MHIVKIFSKVANKCDLGEVEVKLKRDPSKTRWWGLSGKEGGIISIASSYYLSSFSWCTSILILCTSKQVYLNIPWSKDQAEDKVGFMFVKKTCRKKSYYDYHRQEIAGKVRKTWKASHLECRWWLSISVCSMNTVHINICHKIVTSSPKSEAQNDHTPQS